MKEFNARRLDVKGFAEDGGAISGHEQVRDFARLVAETEGRGTEAPVTWSAKGELRNPHHVQPEIWLHLGAESLLTLTCQRCLQPVDMPVSAERSFRFVADETAAAAQDDESEEDVLALSRSFDLLELVEDELLMEMPLAPVHESCPPVRLAVVDEGFEDPSSQRENPFALLGQLKGGSKPGKS
jgi:uncharacterized protein